jgi:hypothetical protein
MNHTQDPPVQASYPWGLAPVADEDGNDPTPRTCQEAAEYGRSAFLRKEDLTTAVYFAVCRWSGNMWTIADLVGCAARGFLAAEQEGEAARPSLFDPPQAPRSGAGPACPKCGGATVLTPGKGPHFARIDCKACGGWRWLPKPREADS